MSFPNRDAVAADTRIQLISSGSMIAPKAGDVLTVKLAKNIESSGSNILIDRLNGQGFVTLANGVMDYTLKAADIPPPGSARWPIIARALDLTLVSDPFYSQNPV